MSKLNSKFAALLLLACATNALPAHSEKAKPAKPVESARTTKRGGAVPLSMTDVVSSTENFALELFQKLSDEKRGENCFISPTSIAICLNMAMAGAQGTTLSAMATALKLPANAETSSAFKQLLHMLASKDPQVELNIANAIFVNKKMPLAASYAQQVGADFNSKISNEDFGNSRATVDKVNAWCKEKTKGHIASIINDVKPSDIAILLNAIYFKGNWSTPFPKADTKDGAFNQQEHPLRVKYMSRRDSFNYFENSDCQAVQLPYGAERFQALVFLPRKNVKLDEFRKQFTSANWKKWQSQFSEYPTGHVVLPRFHIDYEQVLNDSLTKLGMGKIFAGDADFSKMHTPPPNITVSSVIHKTTLDVDETGTVATAVTAISAAGGAAPPSHPRSFEMIVDRPFILAIRDTQTQSLLFIGSVYKPGNDAKK